MEAAARYYLAPQVLWPPVLVAAAACNTGSKRRSSDTHRKPHMDLLDLQGFQHQRLERRSTGHTAPHNRWPRRAKLKYPVVQEWRGWLRVGVRKDSEFVEENLTSLHKSRREQRLWGIEIAAHRKSVGAGWL